MQVIWITVAATTGIICHSSNMVLSRLCSLSNNYQIVSVHRMAIRPVKGSCAGQVALSQCTKRGFAIFTVCFLIQTETSRGQSSSAEKTLTFWMRHTKKQTFLSAVLSQTVLLLLLSPGWLSAGYTRLPHSFSLQPHFMFQGKQTQSHPPSLEDSNQVISQRHLSSSCPFTSNKKLEHSKLQMAELICLKGAV